MSEQNLPLGKQLHNNHDMVFTNDFSAYVDAGNFSLLHGIGILNLYDLVLCLSTEEYFMSLFLDTSKKDTHSVFLF